MYYCFNNAFELGFIDYSLESITSAGYLCILCVACVRENANVEQICVGRGHFEQPFSWPPKCFIINTMWVSACRADDRKHHFRFASAILKNCGFRQIRLPKGPGSPIRSRYHDGNAKNALQKLLPVQGRHHGKWLLSTSSFFMALTQPETIEKTRFRREKRPGKTTSGVYSPC